MGSSESDVSSPNPIISSLVMIPGSVPLVVLSLEIPLLLYPSSDGRDTSSTIPSLVISSTRTSIFGFFGGLLDLLDPLKVGMLGDIGLFCATPLQKWWPTSTKSSGLPIHDLSRRFKLSERINFEQKLHWIFLSGIISAMKKEMVLPRRRCNDVMMTFLYLLKSFLRIFWGAEDLVRTWGPFMDFLRTFWGLLGIFEDFWNPSGDLLGTSEDLWRIWEHLWQPGSGTFWGLENVNFKVYLANF